LKTIDLMSVRELRADLRQALMLLSFARCPDEDCGGQGFTVVPDGDGEAMQQQCQWCHEKSELASD
jgi:hypothetical protein